MPFVQISATPEFFSTISIQVAFSIENQSLRLHVIVGDPQGSMVCNCIQADTSTYWKSKLYFQYNGDALVGKCTLWTEA